MLKSVHGCDSATSEPSNVTPCKASTYARLNIWTLRPWSGQIGLVHGPRDCLRLDPEGLRGRVAN